MVSHICFHNYNAKKNFLFSAHAQTNPRVVAKSTSTLGTKCGLDGGRVVVIDGCCRFPGIGKTLSEKLTLLHPQTPLEKIHKPIKMCRNGRNQVLIERAL